MSSFVSLRPLLSHIFRFLNLLNQGGRITPSQNAQHIIFNRDDGSDGLTPRNEVERRAFMGAQEWQYVLTSSWISECGRQGRLVEEEHFRILTNPTLTSTSMTLRPIIPPTFDPIYHTPRMITPVSSPSMRFPRMSTTIASREGDGSDGAVIAVAGADSEHLAEDGSSSMPVSTPSISAPSKRPRAEVAETSTIEQQHAKLKTSSQVEVMSYGSLKVWIRDPMEYANIKNIPEPQKTCRKKDLFNILVIEIAHWAQAQGQQSIYKGDVGKFLKEDLRKKRPWRDWYNYWRPLKEQINVKLHKLGVNTRTWDLEKGYSHVIYLSDDSDEDNEDGLEGVIRSNGTITLLSDDTGLGQEVPDSASEEIMVKSESEEDDGDDLGDRDSEPIDDRTASGSARPTAPDGEAHTQQIPAGETTLVYQHASQSINGWNEGEDVKPEIRDDYEEEEGEEELFDQLYSA